MKTLTRKTVIAKIANAIVEGGLEPDQIVAYITGQTPALSACSNEELAEQYEFIFGVAVAVR